MSNRAHTPKMRFRLALAYAAVSLVAILIAEGVALSVTALFVEDVWGLHAAVAAMTALVVGLLLGTWVSRPVGGRDGVPGVLVVGKPANPNALPPECQAGFRSRPQNVGVLDLIYHYILWLASGIVDRRGTAQRGAPPCFGLGASPSRQRS